MFVDDLMSNITELAKKLERGYEQRIPEGEPVPQIQG